MKLRNKKTGNVYEVAFHSNYKDGKIAIGVEVDADPKYPKYNFSDYESLKEFCEHWEDYKPADPLIKDELIRKALRASYDAAPYRDNVVYFDGRWTFRGDKFEVMFDDRNIEIEGWTEGKVYCIEELCGEEAE